EQDPAHPRTAAKHHHETRTSDTPQRPNKALLALQPQLVDSVSSLVVGLFSAVLVSSLPS
ncbi:hypothetical protein AB0K20_31145, partial [Micromonospora matsumotoense]|uniref:hypothetical protein n=1 Tax=Micromonospora matsumotoense TaxID=121616 RepID=UPI00343B9F80